MFCYSKIQVPYVLHHAVVLVKLSDKDLPNSSLSCKEGVLLTDVIPHSGAFDSV